MVRFCRVRSQPLVAGRRLPAWLRILLSWIIVATRASGDTPPPDPQDYTVDLVPIATSGLLIDARPWGMRLMGSVRGGRFGSALAAADLDRDGFDDLIIGQRARADTALPGGTVWVLRGSADGLASEILRITCLQPGAGFGEVLAVGDSDGDGWIEVMAARRPGWDGDASGSPFLAVLEWLDPKRLPEIRPVTFRIPHGLPDPGNAWADSLSGGADFDGDGFGDLLAGFPGWPVQGRLSGVVVQFRGSPAGLEIEPRVVSRGTLAQSRHGAAAIVAGDLNGDGYPDAAAGAPDFAQGLHGQGRVEVFLGSRKGLRPEPSVVILGNEAGSGFGRRLVAAGDVDGDGYDDLWISAPGTPQLEASNAGYPGEVYLFRGAKDGLREDPAWVWRGQDDWGRFGWSVASLGDVDGDGTAELAVSEVGGENPRGRTGRVYLFSLSARGERPATALAVQGQDRVPARSWIVAGQADLNGDGIADLVRGSAAAETRAGNTGVVEVWFGRRDFFSWLRSEERPEGVTVREIEVADGRNEPPLEPVRAVVAQTLSLWPRILGFSAGAILLALLGSALVRRSRRLSENRFRAETLGVAESLHEELAAELSRLAESADPEDPAAAPELLWTVRERAGGIARTVREAAWLANPEHDRLTSLADYLADETVRFAGAAELESRTRVPENLRDRPVPFEVRRLCLMALKEFLSGSIRRGGSSQVEFVFGAENGWLRITLSDDGSGLEREPEAEVETRMAEIRRRAEELGGTVELASAPRTGVRFDLRIRI